MRDFRKVNARDRFVDITSTAGEPGGKVLHINPDPETEELFHKLEKEGILTQYYSRGLNDGIRKARFPNMALGVFLGFLGSVFWIWIFYALGFWRFGQ